MNRTRKSPKNHPKSGSPEKKRNIPALFASTIGGGIGSENLKIARGGPSLSPGTEWRVRGGTGAALPRRLAVPTRLNFLCAGGCPFRAGAAGRAAVQRKRPATVCAPHPRTWGEPKNHDALRRQDTTAFRETAL